MEHDPFGLQFVAQLEGIGEIAVMSDGDLSAKTIAGERLGVAQGGRAGRRITGVADRHLAHQPVQNVPVENLRNQAHAFELAKLFAIGGDDTGAFLPSVLQGVKAIIR